MSILYKICHIYWEDFKLIKYLILYLWKEHCYSTGEDKISTLALLRTGH